MTLEYKVGFGLAAIGLGCAIVIGGINMIKSYKEVKELSSYKELKELSTYELKEKGCLRKRIETYGEETIKRIEENGRAIRERIE